MSEPRYYVHSFQHRGERRVWHVADRQSRVKATFVSDTFFSEKPCQKLCDRMNADWKRYLAARLEQHQATK